MEAKQKAIQEAYGEHWENLKNVIDSNGYCSHSIKQYFKEKDFYSIVKKNKLVYRLNSLDGIENNNGWIKIESEADLPIDDSVNYDMYNKNGRAISDLPLKTITQLFEKGIITHYAIHIQRKPPIY